LGGASSTISKVSNCSVNRRFIHESGAGTLLVGVHGGWWRPLSYRRSRYGSTTLRVNSLRMCAPFVSMILARTNVVGGGPVGVTNFPGAGHCPPVEQQQRASSCWERFYEFPSAFHCAARFACAGSDEREAREPFSVNSSLRCCALGDPSGDNSRNPRGVAERGRQYRRCRQYRSATGFYLGSCATATV